MCNLSVKVFDYRNILNIIMKYLVHIYKNILNSNSTYHGENCETSEEDSREYG